MYYFVKIKITKIDKFIHTGLRSDPGSMYSHRVVKLIINLINLKFLISLNFTGKNKNNQK